MTNKNIYNFFLFLSNLTRNLVQVFSIVLLYNKGYSIENILLFLLVMYISGIIVNIGSLIINYKTVLIISTIIYGISYIYLSIMNYNIINLIILAILLSISTYSYHAIRHKLGLIMLNHHRDNNINIILIINYISIIISNILGIILIKKLPLLITSIVIFILSSISIYPIIKLKDNISIKYKYKGINLTRKKITFNILEQFKVILVELQPLYLYIYINNNITYIGIFNIIINIASLIVMIIINNNIKINYIKYITILLGIILTIKLNLNNIILLLLIAFLEGIGIKLFEKNSLYSLYYNIKKSNAVTYLLIEELIFFATKSIIMLIFILLIKDLKMILYICIAGIVLSGFYLKIDK
ncbi:MAG: hypothetical protein IKF19_02300 [Bacilli bacterium]|nr:hypothetical protein [Bacilli bacterium]